MKREGAYWREKALLKLIDVARLSARKTKKRFGVNKITTKGFEKY